MSCKGFTENNRRKIMAEVGNIVPANIVRGIREGKSAWQLAVEKLTRKEAK
jgi:hypothetical protein